MAVVAGQDPSPSLPRPAGHKYKSLLSPLKYTAMYYIRKYADCWAIHNDDNGKSRPLSEKEVTTVQEEYPSLKDPQTCTVYADEIRSLENKP
jgi:hypothetical protein